MPATLSQQPSYSATLGVPQAFNASIGTYAVLSVFGRVGAVVAQAGDYSASQVANAVDSSQVYSNPSWIGSLDYSKITGVPSSVGAVASVFGRTGAITANAGDYTAAKITNAVDATQTYADPAWLTAVSWPKITGVPLLVNTFKGRAGGVVPTVGDYTAAQVTNAVDSSQTYSDPAWLTALNWSKLTGSPSSAQIGGFQTPWLQKINAAGFNLESVGYISFFPTSGTNVGSPNNPVVYSYNGSLIAAVYGTNLLGLYTMGLAPIIFYTNGTEYMRLESSGFLGINKASPAYPLDVTGDANITGSYRINGSLLAAGNVVNAVSTAGSYSDPSWITGLSASKLIGTVATANLGTGTANSTTYLRGDGTWATVSGGSGSQTPWTSDINAATFRLLNAGNVGVGNSLATSFIAAPNAYIQVGSDSGTAQGRLVVCSAQPASGQLVGEFDIVNFSNASADKRIAYILANSANTSGNSATFQIGLANAGAPVTRLQINATGALFAGSVIAGSDFFNLYSSVANQGLMLITNVGTGGQIALRSNNSVNMLQSGNQANSAGQDFRITANNATSVWMTLQASTGNVGIGTTSPTSKLQVAGLPTYASDSAAGTGGLTSGAFYMDATGGLHVKL